MAKQYKKLQNKLHPREKKAASQKPPGKDYLLLAVIAFTVIVTVFGWASFDNWNRAMYAFLCVSLALTYFQRHATLSEERFLLVNRISLAAIGMAIAMFVITLYQRFTS